MAFFILYEMEVIYEVDLSFYCRGIGDYLGCYHEDQDWRMKIKSKNSRTFSNSLQRIWFFNCV